MHVVRNRTRPRGECWKFTSGLMGLGFGVTPSQRSSDLNLQGIMAIYVAGWRVRVSNMIDVAT